MCNDTAAEPVAMRLPRWMIEALDARAKRIGESRSAVIREAIREFLVRTAPAPPRAA